MKKSIHNIHTFLALALLAAGAVSCSDETEIPERADVTFTATLPAEARTRSFGEGTQVNTLTVGVFDGEDNRELQRESICVSGTEFSVKLVLAREQTYNIVFWAYDSDSGCYDVSDLTAIRMNAPTQPVTFEQAEAMDAFYFTLKDITVTDNHTQSVTLKRPLAQVNVGTTGSPCQATFTAKGAPDTFHPLDGTVSGTADFTWKFEDTTDKTFTVDKTKYNYIALGYLFAPATVTQIAAELTLTLTDGETRGPYNFPDVELQANYQSNIAGDFTK